MPKAMTNKISLTGLECTFENLFGQTTTITGTFTTSPEPVPPDTTVTIQFTGEMLNAFTISGLPVPDFSMVISQDIVSGNECPWMCETNKCHASAFWYKDGESNYTVTVELILGGISITGRRIILTDS